MLLLIGLQGYIKNLPEGTVKVVAEGEQMDLEKFIDALAVKGRKYQRFSNRETIFCCHG